MVAILFSGRGRLSTCNLQCSSRLVGFLSRDSLSLSSFGAVSADRSLVNPLTRIWEGHFAVGMKESRWKPPTLWLLAA
jgi:hypothetical protein